jgi:ribosomal protein S18 acetylase RimI-like enzyme
MPHVLDNPTWTSLTGPHARFAQAHGEVIRYQHGITPFIGIPDQSSQRIWTDIAELVGPGGVVPLAGTRDRPPADWPVLAEYDAVQMVDVGLVAAPDPEAVRLGHDDVPEMLDLVRRTEPGPFTERTIELGTYLGVRRDGRLIAMAGERLHPPGWTEISAVCTDEAYRRTGLATRLIRAVAAVIRERGETPFLHVMARNEAAIRLYESIGFTIRRKVVFLVVRTPS